MLLSKSLLENSPGSVAAECLSYPERVIQIGEGNFLRGFADWIIHRLNSHGRFCGRVVIASPRPTGLQNIQRLNQQDGLYTVWLRGILNNERVDTWEVVTSVSRGIEPSRQWDEFLRCAESRLIDIVFSNTTEAGLVYVPEDYHPGEAQAAFPAKLTAYLYHRYQFYSGDSAAGMTILPCELIDNNGDVLYQLVTRYATDWSLPVGFTHWLANSNRFCNTLVDRIVTGYPGNLSNEQISERLGCEDALVTVGEPFHLWAIQGDDSVRERLSVESLGLNVHIVDDISSFRLRKVRILNGAHTAMAAVAALADIATVGEAVADEVVAEFIQHIIWREVIPSLSKYQVSEQDLQSFATDTLERFRNPYIHHKISSLALNGISKLKARVFPTMNDHADQYGIAPPFLSISLAAHLLLYKPMEGESQREIPDDPGGVSLLQNTWVTLGSEGLHNVVYALLGLDDVWGQDLNQLPGLSDQTTEAIRGIQAMGMKAYLRDCLGRHR